MPSSSSSAVPLPSAGRRRGERLRAHLQGVAWQGFLVQAARGSYSSYESDLSEMIGETTFQRYIPEVYEDQLVAPEEIKRHILCTGQVYYTLLQAREERGIKDIAISRIVQLSPFPYDLITPHLDKYPNASLLWCQEEPWNNGVWSYVGPRIYTAAGQTEHHKGKYPAYDGRELTSSVATGSKSQHKKEIAALLDDALTL